MSFLSHCIPATVTAVYMQFFCLWSGTWVVLTSWEPEICTSEYEFGARTKELEVTRDERFCDLKYTFVIPCDVLMLDRIKIDAMSICFQMWWNWILLEFVLCLHQDSFVVHNQTCSRSMVGVATVPGRNYCLWALCKTLFLQHCSECWHKVDWQPAQVFVFHKPRGTQLSCPVHWWQWFGCLRQNHGCGKLTTFPNLFSVCENAWLCIYWWSSFADLQVGWGFKFCEGHGKWVFLTRVCFVLWRPQRNPEKTVGAVEEYSQAKYDEICWLR